MPRTFAPRAFPAASSQGQRQRWRALLDDARTWAALAAGGGTYDRVSAASFTREVIQVAKLAFPLPDAPAQGAAKAFVTQAQTFISTTVAPRRVLLARALLAQASALLEMLDDDATDRARQSWMRQTPGDYD